MTIKLRNATYRDLTAIQALLDAGAAEAADAYPTAYDLPAALHSMINLITMGTVVLAVEPVDTREYVVGILALDVKKPNYNPGAPFLESEHFFIHPEARSKSCDGRSVAAALLEAAKYLSSRAGVPVRVNGFFNDDRSEAREALFEKNGFTYMGANFAWVPEPMPVEAHEEQLREQANAA